ncbi:LuxR C-terminal-related transcriptional regulator, partial [Actinophytocola sp.]|uniref:LuxR C-terminal-related transcriptional regulator n=1 Tax=Actinophytocola sp. TaxID=1872138 RepID=UPI00389A531E
SLDAADNTAGRFWTAVLSAVRACAAVPPANRLHDLRPPVTPDARGFFAEFIDALATLPTPIHLVLDDLQTIVGDEVARGIATLLRHLPRTLRLLLSTRSDPPLPLARLRVQGLLGELRAPELRFSLDEAAELLRLAGVTLTGDQMRRLVEQTEGWPAGLRLAARSLRHAPDREAFLTEFAATDRTIADFLVSEVLASLPVVTTDVLRLVSMCDEVTPPLAAELAGREDAGAILAALAHDSDLVLDIGPDRQWFRVHPLLRAHLRADLTRRRPDLVVELHRTAAVWFAERERPDLAFDHVMRTDEDRMAVDLLRRHAPTVLFSGDDHGVIRSALTKVGAAVADDPRLGLISALAHLAAGDYARGAADLARVSATWPADPDPELVRMSQLVLTTKAVIQGTPPPPASVDWHAVLAAYEGAELEAWTRLGLGWTHLCAGARTEARRELETAERLASENGFDRLAVDCLAVLGTLAGQQGDFTTMAAVAENSILLAGAHGWTSSRWLSADHLMVGLAQLLRLDPAGALEHARNAVAALTPETDSPVLRYLTGVLTGAAHIDAGRLQDGLAQVRRARLDHDTANVPAPLLTTGALIELRGALALGHGTLAQQLMARTRDQVGEVAEVDLMQALTSSAHGAWDAAARSVRRVLDGVRPALRPTTRLEAMLFETALEMRLGRRTRARGALNAALVMAEPASLIEPFHQADAPVRQLLLEQVGGFGTANAFAARVSQALSTMANRRADPLTGREHAVLIRLSSTQSLDEVATDMSVSVNTVKTHVRAIYAKLGVNNRREAVVAGRRYGLN